MLFLIEEVFVVPWLCVFDLEMDCAFGHGLARCRYSLSSE